MEPSTVPSSLCPVNLPVNVPLTANDCVRSKVFGNIVRRPAILKDEPRDLVELRELDERVVVCGDLPLSVLVVVLRRGLELLVVDPFSFRGAPAVEPLLPCDLTDVCEDFFGFFSKFLCLLSNELVVYRNAPLPHPTDIVSCSDDDFVQRPHTLSP